MRYYIKKDKKFLAITTKIVEDDYWEPAEINEMLMTYSHWVSDPADAKSFYNRIEAEMYMKKYRYKECEVVELRT